MQNFNTNQTRHFYVAKAVDANVDTNLDIALKQTATGELFFSYRNADGLLTRSDTFDPKKITSLKNTAAADLALPIICHKITADTTAVSLGSSLIGKVFSCMVTLHQVFDYDEANSQTFTASIVGDSTNMASANSNTAFYKAMALELAKVLPADLIKVYCGSNEVTKSSAISDISGNPTAIYLIPKVQKYVRGKLAAETGTLSVAFRLHDGDDTVWGKDDATKTVAAVNTADTLSLTPASIDGVYQLADLEYFALGERGDMFRHMNYPNNWETTYAIDVTKSYDVLTIEYYWAGNVENVQKSPRMIQVACEKVGGSTSVAGTLYDAVAAAMAGASS